MDIIEKLKSRFDDYRIVQPDEVSREACHEIEKFRRVTASLRRLAVAIHSKHYPEIVNWGPLEDAEGLLLQIDNMTAELVRMVGQPEIQSSTLGVR